MCLALSWEQPGEGDLMVNVVVDPEKEQLGLWVNIPACRRSNI
jgi:hypothetical protein